MDNLDLDAAHILQNKKDKSKPVNEKFVRRNAKNFMFTVIRQLNESESVCIKKHCDSFDVISYRFIFQTSIVHCFRNISQKPIAFAQCTTFDSPNWKDL